MAGREAVAVLEPGRMPKAGRSCHALFLRPFVVVLQPARKRGVLREIDHFIVFVRRRDSNLQHALTSVGISIDVRGVLQDCAVSLDNLTCDRRYDVERLAVGIDPANDGSFRHARAGRGQLDAQDVAERALAEIRQAEGHDIGTVLPDPRPQVRWAKPQSAR